MSRIAAIAVKTVRRRCNQLWDINRPELKYSGINLMHAEQWLLTLHAD